MYKIKHMFPIKPFYVLYNNLFHIVDIETIVLHHFYFMATNHNILLKP